MEAIRNLLWNFVMHKGSTSVVKSAGDSSADVLGAAFKALTDKQNVNLV